MVYQVGAMIVDETDCGDPVLRLDTIFSQLESSSVLYLQDVLEEAVATWRQDGRDVIELRNATVRWRDRGSNSLTEKVSVFLD